jgi:hypothetical protein
LRAAHPHTERADADGPAASSAIPASVELQGVFSRTAAIPSMLVE